MFVCFSSWGVPCPKLRLMFFETFVEVPNECLRCGRLPHLIYFVNTSMSNFVILCISASYFCFEFRLNEGNNFLLLSSFCVSAVSAQQRTGKHTTIETKWITSNSSGFYFVMFNIATLGEESCFNIWDNAKSKNEKKNTTHIRAGRQRFVWEKEKKRKKTGRNLNVQKNCNYFVQKLLCKVIWFV